MLRVRLQIINKSSYIMIFTAILLGLAMGVIVNWAEETLVGFSMSGKETEPKMNSGLTPVLWSLLATPLFRKRLYHGNKEAWLRIFVEVFLALLFAFLWQRLGFTIPFLFLTALCSFLVLIALIDLKHRLVLNILILPAMGAIFLFQAVPLSQSTWLSLGGGAAAFLLFLLAAIVAPGRLGGGDIKLAAFLGLVFGFPYVFWALMVGALMGGVTAVFLLSTKRGGRTSRFPYAPFLCLGAIVALFYDPTAWLFA